MKAFKHIFSATSVHKLFTTVMFVTVLLVGGMSWGADKIDPRSFVNKNNCKKYLTDSDPDTVKVASAVCEEAADQKADKIADYCEKSYKEYSEARNNTDKDCRDAGMGAGDACRKALSSANCAKEIEQANSEALDAGASNTDFTTILLNSIGLGDNKSNVAQNPNQKPGKSTCTIVTGKSFYADRDKLKADLKDAQKELADMKKDITSEQADYDKQYKEIQKHIKDEQKRVRDEKADLDKQVREMSSKMIETQQQLSKQMKDNELKIVRLQSAIVKNDSDLAIALTQISETAAKRTCNKQVLELKKQLDAYNGGGGVGGLIGAGSVVMKKLKEEFDNCMSGIDEQRASVYKSAQSSKNDLMKQLENANADSADISDQINSLQSQVQQEKNAIETKKSDADKDLYEEISSTTQELAALQKTTTQKINAMNEQLGTIQQRINELNAELMAMNRQPLPPKDSTKNKDDVDASYFKEKMLEPKFTSICCSNQEYAGTSVCQSKAPGKAKTSTSSGNAERQ